MLKLCTRVFLILKNLNIPELKKLCGPYFPACSKGYNWIKNVAMIRDFRTQIFYFSHVNFIPHGGIGGKCREVEKLFFYLKKSVFLPDEYKIFFFHLKKLAYHFFHLIKLLFSDKYKKFFSFEEISFLGQVKKIFSPIHHLFEIPTWITRSIIKACLFIVWTRLKTLSCWIDDVPYTNYLSNRIETIEYNQNWWLCT